MTFDPIAVLRVLQDEQVDFVVIGGIAAGALGSPSATIDLDICPSADSQNIARLAAALDRIGAKEWDVRKDMEVERDFLASLPGDKTWMLVTNFGRLDLLFEPSGTGGFDDLVNDAVSLDLDGTEVLVSSIDDLIRMKRAADRPQDRIELEILGALREELGP